MSKILRKRVNSFVKRLEKLVIFCTKCLKPVHVTCTIGVFNEDADRTDEINVITPTKVYINKARG